MGNPNVGINGGERGKGTECAAPSAAGRRLHIAMSEPDNRVGELVDALTPEQANWLLAVLLRRHEDLLPEAEALMDDQWSQVEPDDVAEELIETWRALDIDDLNQRSAPSRYGYTSPDEAAWELLEEPLEPWQKDIRRRLALSRRQEALRVLQGVLLALYQASTMHHDVWAWAPDFFSETAQAWWHDWCQENPPELEESFLDRVPDWLKFFL